MPHADSEDCAISTLHEIATKKFGHESDRLTSYVAFQLPNAAAVEISDDCPVAVVILLTIRKQPILHQARYSALLASFFCVAGMHLKLLCCELSYS
jgi:hypothetical protein